MGMNLFAKLTKVDEAKRLIYGRIAEEAVDKSDEIMDYASSKPLFQAWSAEIAKDTDGKSLGNVRAMHGKVAAGKLVGIDFGDAAKVIDVGAKVVDDNEWNKVLEGVYTGFSIGGSYVGDSKVEKIDGRDVKRYTAKPSEVSLVDRPCMTGAKFFEVHKADGSLAKVDFKPPAIEPVDVVGTDDEVVALGKLMNEHGLSLAEVVGKALPAWLADKKKKADGEKGDDKAKDDDGKGDDDKAAEEEAAKVAAAAELAKTASEDSLTKVEEALKDALAKIGARNSGADAGRIGKIHDMAVELGATCAADKADKGALGKLDEGAIQKMVDAALAPLQKSLTDAQTALAAADDRVKKLEAQPARTTISLRAVSKEADTDPNSGGKPVEKTIVDDTGAEHKAATLIKSIHAQGGRPMTVPNQFPK